MLPPPDISVAYVDEKTGRPTKDFFNWIKALNLGVAGGGQREILTGARSYFVNGSTGSNSNNGLTGGTAFLTIQKAYDVVQALDFNNNTVTINIADGTYAPASGVPVLNVTLPWVGGGTLAFVGNTTTPANCLLSSTNSDNLLFNAVLTGIISLAGLKLTTVTGGNCISMVQPGQINLSGKMEFGACAAFQIASGAAGALFITRGQPYTISGGALAHFLAAAYGSINSSSSTVTVSGTPAFSVAFVWATRIGFVDAEAVTYSGAATGTRYVADNNAVIYTGTGTANYFPGNIAGSTGSGGQYS